MASTQSASPSSQKSGVRPISFVLVDSSNPSGSILASNALTLYIRPEDLTRTDTSRISAQQTLGGIAWADNFGRGIPTINISGHTGWRRPDDPALGTDDGVDRFKKLKNQVFNNWHARRQVAIENGKDPDSTVQLQFVDQLDSITAVVAPMSFALRRNRYRPLLMQYQISMIVTQDNIATPRSVVQSIGNLPIGGSNALSGPQRLAAGLTSLASSVSRITKQVGLVQTYIDASIAAPVAQFMLATNTVFNAVMDAVGSVQGVTNSLIAVGQLTAQCGVNIFRSLAAVAGLPQFVKSQIMDIAGAYSNAFCIMFNVFNQQLIYPAYQPIYGSSNCSSTSGGSPPSALAGLNPFQYIYPQQTLDAVTMSTQAHASMTSMANTDIVRAPPSISTIGNVAGTAAAGLVKTS